jgi:hypothetical protein
MRKRRDLGGHAMLGQRARNVLFPNGGPDQPLVESIRLPQLETDSLDRVPEVLGRRLLAEGVQDALFMRREVVCRVRGESPQQVGVARLGIRHAAFPLRRRCCGIEAQHFVDQAEIPIVVQQTLVGRDFRVHANPKAHVALEFRGMNEGIGGLGERGMIVEERSEQEP